MESNAATVMLYDWLPAPNCGSWAVTTKTNVPAVVGVPVMVAMVLVGVLMFSDRPGGKFPFTLHVVGPFPFVEMVVPEYNFVVNPAGSTYVPGPTVGGGAGERTNCG